MQLTLRSLALFALVACARASPAVVRPHELTADAAQDDDYLLLCDEASCSGCARFDSVGQLPRNTCFQRQFGLSFASAYVHNAEGTPLPYGFFASHFANCSDTVQLQQVDTCYNGTYNGATSAFKSFIVLNNE